METVRSVRPREIAVVKLPRPEQRRSSAVDVGDQLGAYRLLRLISVGNGGRLYEVEQTTSGRRLAMKILPAEHAGSPEVLRAAFSTARAVDQLKHPHLGRTTDLIEGNVNALVGELLEGRSLGQLTGDGGPLEIERVVGICAQIVDALGALHGVCIVHGNLKPENVFLVSRAGTSDYVVLLDAGLPGNSAYAAPEQVARRPFDQRADIHAFGVVLYELLCGWLPFEAGSGAEPPAAPRRVTATAAGRTLGGL